MLVNTMFGPASFESNQGALSMCSMSVMLYLRRSSGPLILMMSSGTEERHLRCFVGLFYPKIRQKSICIYGCLAYNKHMYFGSLTLDANFFVFAVLGLFLGCGILFGEARLKRVVTGALIGLFAADQLADFVATQLSNAKVDIDDQAVLKIALLLIVAIPLSLGKAPSVGGRFSIRSIVLAVFAAMTVIAFVSNFLSDTLLGELETEYNLIALATDNRSWWLAGLLLWLVILHVWKPKSKDDDDGKGKRGKKK